MEIEAGRWYALQVRPKCEQFCIVLLQEKGYEVFLPLRPSRRQAPALREKPLFGGYVFCRALALPLAPIVTTSGVVRILGFGRKPSSVPESEIEAIQALVRSGVAIRPWQFLPPGCKVVIQSGPLAGIEGTLVTTSSTRKLVVSVNLLQRSVAAALDDETEVARIPSMPPKETQHAARRRF